MNDFLLFFNDLVHRFPLHLQISYNKTCDWVIEIYKKGCASDFQKSESLDGDAIVVYENSNDMELCFAKAHVALKEWMLENNGGY